VVPTKFYHFQLQIKLTFDLFAGPHTTTPSPQPVAPCGYLVRTAQVVSQQGNASLAHIEA